MAIMRSTGDIDQDAGGERDIKSASDSSGSAGDETSGNGTSQSSHSPSSKVSGGDGHSDPFSSLASISLSK